MNQIFKRLPYNYRNYLTTTIITPTPITSHLNELILPLDKTIEIKDLPLNITTNDLWDQFKEYNIKSHGISINNGNKKGFGYITFGNENDFFKALNKKVFSYNNVNYDIEPVKPSPLLLDQQEQPTTTLSTDEISNSSIRTTPKPKISSPYLNQSVVTQQLWVDRELKKFNPLLTQTPNLITKTPDDSMCEVNLLFSTDLALREMYLSPYGHLRIGRLLEDLDALAATVGFKHAENDCDGYKKMVVTASVDRIKLLQPLIPDRDIKMKGRVTWVGRSSMEIMITVDSKDNNTKNWDPIIQAYFTMVAIDPLTSKSTPVNHLKITTDLEKTLFSDAEKHKLQRLSSDQQSLEKQPPTSQELQTIHNLFMLTKKNQLKQPSLINSGVDSSIPIEIIPIDSTHLESVILCQPQEKNINGSIFGGYLMRKGFENAFTAVYLKFHESLPRFRGMDDIQFLTPVNIGDIVTFKSTIVYSKPVGDGHSKTYYTQVEVLAYVTNPNIGEEKLSNVFNFTFYCAPSSKQQEQQQKSEKLKQITPNTYSEAMRYLSGKRIIDRYY